MEHVHTVSMCMLITTGKQHEDGFPATKCTYGRARCDAIVHNMYLASRSNSVSVSSVAVAPWSVVCCKVRLLAKLKGRIASSLVCLVVNAMLPALSAFGGRIVLVPPPSSSPAALSGASSSAGLLRILLRLRPALRISVGGADNCPSAAVASAAALTGCSATLAEGKSALLLPETMMLAADIAPARKLAVARCATRWLPLA